MNPARSVAASIVKVTDSETERVYAAYRKRCDTWRLLEMKRQVSLLAMASEMERPDFDRRMEKLRDDLEKHFAVGRDDLMKAHREFQSVIGGKLGYKPAQTKPSKKLDFRGVRWPVTAMNHFGATPECALVDEPLTFLAARYFDHGMFDVVEALPDTNTATSVRAKVDGEHQSSMLTTAWGLEVTDTFLTDHCKLLLGGTARASGLVCIGSGGSVTINLDTFVGVFRLPGVTLQQLIPGTNTFVPEPWFASWQFSPTPFVDSNPGPHPIPVLEDFLDVTFLDNGMFGSGPGFEGSLVEPGFVVQAGDKIIIQISADIRADSSSVHLHLDDVGTLRLYPYVMHYKWH